MISLPQQSDLPIGQIISYGGEQLMHMGGGKFRPVGQTLAKRFDASEGEPLHRQVA